MTLEDKENSQSSEEGHPIYSYFIVILVIITIILLIFRIVINLNIFIFHPQFALSRDADFIILHKGMSNGLIDFYKPIDYMDFPPYYLYYWYFIFFPMSLIPVAIGVYIWDILRFLCCVFVMKESSKIITNSADKIILNIFISFSYCIDGFFNNVNFLILFLLFCSYLAYEKDQKWVAGILFALAVFKINAIIFLPILLLVKKIKIKDILYFIIPLALLCIPYLIWPDYLMQMVNNWTYEEDILGEVLVEDENLLLGLLIVMDNVIWKALQPTHLMYFGFIIILFLENIKSDKWRIRYRLIICTLAVIYSIRLFYVRYIIDVFVLGVYD